MRFSTTPRISGVFASPAARRAAVDRQMLNKHGVDTKIVDTKLAASSWTSGVGENGATITGANRIPATTTGIDTSTPAIRLWRRKWSASRGFFAPNARATRAIV